MHSLGEALLRGSHSAPRGAIVTLLGRKRRRGRRAQAAPSWEHQAFDIFLPVNHHPQNHDILVGILPNDLQHHYQFFFSLQVMKFYGFCISFLVRIKILKMSLN
jgi:hypothetical protein